MHREWGQACPAGCQAPGHNAGSMRAQRAARAGHWPIVAGKKEQQQLAGLAPRQVHPLLSFNVPRTPVQPLGWGMQQRGLVSAGPCTPSVHPSVALCRGRGLLAARGVLNVTAAAWRRREGGCAAWGTGRASHVTPSPVKQPSAPLVTPVNSSPGVRERPPASNRRGRNVPWLSEQEATRTLLLATAERQRRCPRRRVSPSSRVVGAFVHVLGCGTASVTLRPAGQGSKLRAHR